MENSQSLLNLKKISNAIFEDDLRQQYLNKAWFDQWGKLIPSYIEWHVANEKDGWQYSAGEASLQKEITLSKSRSLTLEGRVDRVDKKKIEGTDFFSIVDYKTGGYKKLSRDSDVVGEDVQLISYCSLIGDRAIKASYLVLDKSLMEITVSGD